MSPNHERHTLFLAPTSAGYGASAVALGLIRAYQREGFSVGFAKPVSDMDLEPGTLDRSTHFTRILCGLFTPDPIPAEHAEESIHSGNEATLLEDIVALVESTREYADIVIVEGMAPNPEHSLPADLNISIARNLSAEVIVVVMCQNTAVQNVIDIIADAAHRYSGEERRLSGAILVRAPDASYRVDVAQGLSEQSIDVPLLGVMPYDHALTAPRLIDVAKDLGFKVDRHGDIHRARVSEIVVAARGPEQLVTSLRPGTLVVTPGDRSDLVLTAALARIGGMPIAGLLLTCGESLAPEIDSFLSPRFGNMPILKTELETFEVAQRLSAIDWHVTLDDLERMNRVMDFIADHLDLSRLTPTHALATSGLMSPPMFRHRLMQEARSVPRRIVLPEGDEPRTIHAAVICAEKGIAHCVLLGEPQHIRSIALTHGINLPEQHEFLEILDPATLRENYVKPMVLRRKSKGLTAHQAEKELEDSVVLGTMMLAEGHVDGMVSGAVHTTASTVRPALQLIRTKPGSSIVSSVFFMLMPDQVLVYGDCAVNPNPTAEELAEIAIQSADSAAAFGIEPRVAMISYSTGASGTGDDVDKVRSATALVRQRRPELVVDGPIQYDAASVESVGLQKAPASPLHGHANVFIFPDLNTGNTTYKAVQRSANVVSIGPMLQGLRKPVNDLSRGALVDDIVYTIALTAIQAGPELSGKAG